MEGPKPGDILSHAEMCAFEGMSLQRGMNFRSGGRASIILMSLRKGAPYSDRLEDDGRCVQCGSSDNLHFDHIVPFSRGGTSLLPENIQLLCARHNLAKSNRIQ